MINMSIIDKRLEFLEALVIATKQYKHENNNEELDFVEFYDIPYVKELIYKININKYPEIVDFIYDIDDCSYYTNLFLFFDDRFNLIDSPSFKPFKNRNISEFAVAIKNLYETEKIDEVFEKYNSYLSNIENSFKKYNNINYKELLDKLYGLTNNLHFIINISLLINGGFSSTKCALCRTGPDGAVLYRLQHREHDQ